MTHKIRLIITLLSIVLSLNAFSKSLISNPENITIYWDASFSMKGKNLIKELDFLDNYFNNVRDVQVELISFRNTINPTDTFKIVNSDWSTLKSALLKIKYDGVAYFELLEQNRVSDTNLIFTDGLEVLDKLKVATVTPTFIINSSNKSNNALLNSQSLTSGGNFIDLNNLSIKDGLALILDDDIEIVLLDNPKVTSEITLLKKELVQKENDMIKGTVLGDEGLLIGATIKVKEKDIGAVTDINGEYEIDAKKGDLLIVRYLGKYTKEITVEDSQILDILLISDKKKLKEIKVSGKRINDNKEVDLVDRKVEERKLGYAVQSIKGDDLTDSRSDNLSLHGKISGTSSYGQNSDISQIVLRANSILSNVFPLIILDGAPIRRSSSVGRTSLSNFIDPSNIADIKILKGLAATNRWGSEGSNGVFIITSKTNDFSQSKNAKPYNKALLRNNDYTDNLSVVDASVKKNYIEELKKYKTVNQKYDYYLAQRNNYLNDFQYFTNVSSYMNQIGENSLSIRILSNILENDFDNVKTMRFVAYTAEQAQNYTFAKDVFEKIAELKPNESQTYKDLAMVYQETGEYQQALDIYNKIVSNRYSNVNFSELKKNIINDMKRMILKHKKKIKLKKTSSEYTSTKKFNYDARIVFDWNNRDAEFELQFVNPQKKFFTWAHTKKKNANRIYKEKAQGFSSEEFLLIDAAQGEWLINIECNTKESKIPMAIKYTVYKKMGEASEVVEKKLLILNNINKKQMVGKIIVK